MPEAALTPRDAALCRVLDNIKTDPDLQAIERNVALVSHADSDVFRFDVEVPSLVKRFLLHPEAEIEEIRVSDGDRFGARLPLEEYEEGHVTGAMGRIPVGCLKVSESARSRSTWNQVVASGVLDYDPRDGDSDE